MFKKNKVKFLIFIVVVAVLLLWWPGRQVLAPHKIVDSGLYKVVEIIDGDTIKLESGVKVRLIGVDAPEKGECFYEQARQGLKSLLENQPVRLEKDVTNQDKYGRWLRYVYIPLEKREDVLVNEWLVWQGYARVVNIPPDNRWYEKILMAEQKAKQAKRGMWGECNR